MEDRDEAGRTAFHTACAAGHPECAAHLVAEGCDTGTRYRDDKAPAITTLLSVISPRRERSASHSFPSITAGGTRGGFPGITTGSLG